MKAIDIVFRVGTPFMKNSYVYLKFYPALHTKMKLFFAAGDLKNIPKISYAPPLYLQILYTMLSENLVKSQNRQ